MKRGIILAIALLCMAAAAAKPVKVVHKSKALDFTYSWPSEAAAIPTLNARFRADLAKSYSQALADAREDAKMYREQQRTGMQDLFLSIWTSAGETPRLLSLQQQLSTFTGGAHPNTGYDALLWDRKLNREIKVGSLFGRPASLAAITRTAYCKALDKERLKRREGMTVDVPEFNACPKFSELAISPADKSGNGRFDAIHFVASPYTAGPYSEGKYEIPVPVSPELIAAMKPEYRASFEPQRQ
jgi:hypothetical protein